MSNPLTESQVKEYIRKGGPSCPSCGDPDLEGGPVDISEGFAIQEVHCLGCGASWNDVYELRQMQCFQKGGEAS